MIGYLFFFLFLIFLLHYFWHKLDHFIFWNWSVSVFIYFFEKLFKIMTWNRIDFIVANVFVKELFNFFFIQHLVLIGVILLPNRINDFFYFKIFYTLRAVWRRWNRLCFLRWFKDLFACFFIFFVAFSPENDDENKKNQTEYKFTNRTVPLQKKTILNFVSYLKIIFGFIFKIKAEK